jgi:hypothetical protein
VNLLTIRLTGRLDIDQLWTVKPGLSGGKSSDKREFAFHRWDYTSTMPQPMLYGFSAFIIGAAYAKQIRTLGQTEAA